MFSGCKRFVNRHMDNKGFSLVELIVVIAIMIVLLSIIVPNVVSYVKKANRIADLSTAKQLSDAVALTIGTDEHAKDMFLLCATYGSSVSTSSSATGALLNFGGKRFVRVCRTSAGRYDASKSWAQLDGFISENATTRKQKNWVVTIRNEQQDWNGTDNQSYVALKIREALGPTADLTLKYRESGCDRFFVLAEYKTINYSIWAGDGNGPKYMLWPEVDPGWANE